VVWCMDAAPVVWAPCLGCIGCFTRLLVKAPSGRQRLPGLAAFKASTHALSTGEHLTSMTAATVCALWRLGAGAQAGIPLRISLATARDPRGALGQAVAPEFGRELRCWPSSSPTLHLIERWWRVVKNQCWYSKDDPERTAFQQAIWTGIQHAPTTHTEELNRLWT
jgi:hypothetical protein